jgi:hypothetical protein
MGKYAVTTSVSVEKSKEEVTKILRKYGADRFGTMEDRNKAYLMFEYNKLMIQIIIPLPNRDDFHFSEAGRKRKGPVVDSAYEQAIKQKWRALVLAVKAKLEAVESGISTIEQEFMAFVMMPDGRNLSEHVLPELENMSKDGKMPRLLLGGNGR